MTNLMEKEYQTKQSYIDYYKINHDSVIIIFVKETEKHN